MNIWTERRERGCLLVFSQKILKGLSPYFFREVGAYVPTHANDSA